MQLQKFASGDQKRQSRDRGAGLSDKVKGDCEYHTQNRGKKYENKAMKGKKKVERRQQTLHRGAPKGSVKGAFRRTKGNPQKRGMY